MIHRHAIVVGVCDSLFAAAAHFLSLLFFFSFSLSPSPRSSFPFNHARCPLSCELQCRICSGLGRGMHSRRRHKSSLSRISSEIGRIATTGNRNPQTRTCQNIGRRNSSNQIARSCGGGGVFRCVGVGWIPSPGFSGIACGIGTGPGNQSSSGIGCPRSTGGMGSCGRNCQCWFGQCHGTTSGRRMFGRIVLAGLFGVGGIVPRGQSATRKRTRDGGFLNVVVTKMATRQRL